MSRLRRRISLATVRRVLLDVAAEYPDRVDPRVERGLPPRYCEHGRPACLVAEVLTRLGWTIVQLRELDREGQMPAKASVGGTPLAHSRNRRLRRIELTARRMLDELQRQQDRGWSWSRAVAWVLQEDSHGRYWRASGHVKPWNEPLQPPA